MSLVSLVKIQKEKLDKAILDSLRLIEYDFPSGVRDIVIKPNLCYYWDYSTGYTTDPRFVSSLIDVLRERISPRVKITLVESDASAMKCKYAFKILGYEKLANRSKVSLVNLSEEKSVTVKTSVGEHSVTLKVPNVVKNAHLRINVPKIKYSMRTIKMTCALKNVFGCNPYPRKFNYHSRLEETIVAINKAMKFDLCIVDGNTVFGVQPRRLGLVMASTDPVALDAAAAGILGIGAKRIRLLRLASREGLGKTSFVPKGVPLKYFKARYPKKGVSSKIKDNAFDVVLKLHLGSRLGLE